MNRFLTRVTVTGADDSIEPQQLVELSTEFPFVEFGILLSREAMGCPRFPSRGWLVNLMETCADRKMQFAGHICGEWVTELLSGQWPQEEFLNIHKEFISFGMFRRWQINTHGIAQKVDYVSLLSLLRELEERGQAMIFQYDAVNTDLIRFAVNSGVSNIAALFDLSHGAGKLPEQWPLPLSGIECGYAGGLSPHNVAVQLERIASIIGDRHIWIDAETKLRSRNDLVFDIRKIRTFLAAASPWVV